MDDLSLLILQKMLDLCKYYYIYNIIPEDKISEINDMLMLDNSFTDKYLNIMDDFRILFIQNNFDNLTNFISKLDKLIKNNCNHEYIYDLIDIDPDRSQTIEYCKKCFTTKN
jgi:hypothetical protein